MDKNQFLSYCNKFDKTKYLKFENYIFIGKKFLSKLLKSNVYHDSFTLVRKEVVNLTEDKKFPESETDFYFYLCNKYLKIQVLPMKTVIQDYFDIVEDIKILDSNITLCKTERDKLEKVKTQKSYFEANENYLFLRLNYLININKQKREKKINFLINELSKGKTYTRRSDNLFFRMKEKELTQKEITTIDEITNKFLYFPPDRIEEFRNSKKADEKQFRLLVSEYISLYDIVEQIDSEVQNNYFLSLKKCEFNNLLNAYNKKELFTFINLVPLFIEGIFYDVCIELGATEKEMMQSSLNCKLDFIYKNVSCFIEYEYFAFSFPVLRNKIAHGKLNTEDNSYFANMLLLDLLSVVKFCNSDVLPNNSYRKQIAFIFDHPSLNHFYWVYTNNRDYFKRKINSNYPEAEKLDKLLSSLKTIDYLNYLENWKGDPEKAIKILVSLKKDGFEQNKVTEIIKKIKEK